MQACSVDAQNSPWSQMPYDGTANSVTGILNVVGGSCIEALADNLTLLHFQLNHLQSDSSVTGGLEEVRAPKPAQVRAACYSVARLNTTLRD